MYGLDPSIQYSCVHQWKQKSYAGSDLWQNQQTFLLMIYQKIPKGTSTQLYHLAIEQYTSTASVENQPCAWKNNVALVPIGRESPQSCWNYNSPN